jgi:predicted anti-sigma-YlaC factor YlaD
MTCRELIEFLSDYLDGELPPDVRAKFDEHLADCGQCRRYLSQYRTAGDLAKLAKDDAAAAPPLPADLVKAIVDAATKK